MEEDDQDESLEESSNSQEMSNVLTKLRGMKLQDRDEVIDALISQEGF
jgi:hypothetical protein